MNATTTTPAPAQPLPDDELEFDVAQLARACRCDVDLLVALVHEGAIGAAGDDPADWRFEGAVLQRARLAIRLARDLDVNPPGVALALDLLDELAALRAQLPPR